MTERIGGRLGDLKTRAEYAQEKFEKDKAQLYRSDGAQLFSEDEHKERLAGITRERNATLKQVEEDVRSETTALDEKIANVKNRDVAELLTQEELSSANNRRDFAIDAAETLGVEELVGRMRSVLASDDKGVIFAYLNAGERRRREILHTRPGGAGVSSATELDGVLSEMRKALDPGADAELEALKEKQSKSVQVELLAGNLKYGARNSVDRYLKQTYGDVAERIGARRG